ncbi:hypothetical protein Q1695_006692 [Nippostrongylus brasiliensis]|nr:hypothetical protein Q1695_006692 [Nippostrongylus brasiliensis]
MEMEEDLVRMGYVRSQEGVSRSDPPSNPYFNPIALHIKQKNYVGSCECQVHLWSEQFYNTASILFIAVIIGTLAMLYCWAGIIYEKKRWRIQNPPK